MRRWLAILEFCRALIASPLAGGLLCLTTVGCGAGGQSSPASSQGQHHSREDHDHEHSHTGHEHDHGHDHAGHEHSHADHDHEEHDHGEGHTHEGHEDQGHASVEMPKTYAEAVAKLRDYRQQIVRAVADGQPENAHDPLDEMDEVIEHLMPIARDSGIRRTDWEEINVARRALRAELDLVHAAIDAGQAPDMTVAEKQTTAALARLEAVSARAAEPPPSSSAPDTPADKQEMP